MKFTFLFSSRLLERWLIALLFIWTFSLPVCRAVTDPPFYTKAAEQWADSVITQLTPGERIAQLMMVAAWSNKDSTHIREIIKLIEDYHIGGLTFFQGGPVRQAMLTNYYQSISKVPLLIGFDGEWGLAMRLDSTIRFPRQMTLAAIPGDTDVYSMGSEIARECRRLGIHVNFAPDADINNNPLNPVIGSRSFGDERELVTRKSVLYMKALQDQHILASGKHFPGHGNADTDSHLALPMIHQSREQMDSVELYPFRRLISEGLGSMMVAHLNIPSLDSTPNLPSTLSSPIVNGLLKEQMKFKGLVFTDALNMKGVSACYQPGVLDKLALLAGNDILLLSEDVHKAIDEIQLAVQQKEISQEEIDRRVKKLLMVKFWCGLNEKPYIDTTHLAADLNSGPALYLQRTLFEKSVTVLADRDSMIPLRHLDSLKVASIVIGDVKNNPFQQQLIQYANVDCYAIEKDAPLSIFNAFYDFLCNYDVVILSLHGTTMKAQTNYGIPDVAQAFIDNTLHHYKTMFVDFGNAYTLSRFGKLDDASSVVIAYEDFPLTQTIAAQLLMGGFRSSGRLPVNSTSVFRRGSGADDGQLIRFKYTVPEDAGLSSEKLLAIDSIVNQAISGGAMPGCQVLVVKDQKVVYQKSFGNKTYDSTEAVRNSDLYDIASVTKIAATSLAAMKLYEDGKIDIDQPLSKYLPRLKSTNKKNLIIRDVLAHQAGLQSWTPFWKLTMTETGPSGKIYRKKSVDGFTVRVADSLYMKKSYTDSLMQWIYNSPVGERGNYLYSDFGPILMKSLVEKVSGTSIDHYLGKYFYTPLLLSDLSFLPREHFPLSQIVPTEQDNQFRHQLVRGDVHDPAAAMLGGISGNAGLFSNASDLSIIMQMLLNKGVYGGKRYLKPETIALFTSQQFPQNHNRRGLFFDKPELDSTKTSPCAREVSPETFGHQGFTGTCAWVDPKYRLVYVFLSNRVCPDVANDKLIKWNVRTNIQQAIYRALINP